MKAVLAEAGYDSLEELQDEIETARAEYKKSSGPKKARAKEDLDEMLDVLAQYNAAIKSSGGAAPQKQVQDIHVYVLHMNAGIYLLLFVQLLISIRIMIRALVCPKQEVFHMYLTLYDQCFRCDTITD